MLKNIGSSISEKENELDPEYLVLLSELMKKNLPRPKHKTRILVSNDEWVPIVTETVGLWDEIHLL